MSKTWGEIRSETLNLGFEKIKAYSKNKSAYIEAYNFAQSYIASEMGVLTDSLTINKRATVTDAIYDLVELASDEGKEFVTLSDVGVLDSDRCKADNIWFTQNRFITIPADVTDRFYVYYNYLPTRITETSSDDTVCELPEKWATLMPYLMANRLFMDDDASISGYYWNLYEQMKQRLLSREYTPTVTIVGNINIDTNMEW